MLHLRVGNGSKAARLPGSQGSGQRPKGSQVSCSPPISRASSPILRLGLSHTTYLQTESSVHPECPFVLPRVLKNGSNGSEKIGAVSPYFVADQSPMIFFDPSGSVHDFRPEIRSLITHLRAHSMYFPAFESPFLKMTMTYYTDESARLMKALKSDPAEFMRRCLERVKHEVNRAKEMFIEDSWEKIRAVCETALFEPSHSWVAIDGAFHPNVTRTRLMTHPLALPKFMDDKDMEKLGEMYITFTRAKCADEVLRSFKHYVYVSCAAASC